MVSDPEIIKIQIDGFVQIAKWISYLILIGAGLSVTVSLMRITGGENFKIGDLELPLSRFVHVAIALTAAHAFLTWIFVQRANEVVALGKQNAEFAWQKLVNSEAFVFFNMQPRVLITAPWPFRRVYAAQSTDTAFWLTTAFEFAIVTAAVLALSSSNKSKQILESSSSFCQKLLTWFNFLAIGCGLAAINWFIGSQWAIAASRLAYPE